MSELRQDPTTNAWVIIAHERAKRPNHFARSKEPAEPPPPYRADCPFCEGNESITPAEEWAYRSGMPNGPGWWVRTIPNKFAALQMEGSMERKDEFGLFRRMDGVGKHEVIVEAPRHDASMALMSSQQVEEIVLMYRDRYLFLREDPRFKYLTIFKNYGERAGTSLEHPHSQVVATPIVPAAVRHRLDVAMQYYDNTGKCIYCDVLIVEQKVGARIVYESDRFVAFHPFASRSPFETWIFPKVRQSAFGQISIGEAKEFAHVLRIVLLKLHKGLENPDYNAIIHTVPFKDEVEEYYMWHMQIVPRVSHVSGFEMGSGIYINSAVPEETAAFMRRIEV